MAADNRFVCNGFPQSASETYAFWAQPSDGRAVKNAVNFRETDGDEYIGVRFDHKTGKPKLFYFSDAILVQNPGEEKKYPYDFEGGSPVATLKGNQFVILFNPDEPRTGVTNDLDAMDKIKAFFAQLGIADKGEKRTAIYNWVKELPAYIERQIARIAELEAADKPSGESFGEAAKGLTTGGPTDKPEGDAGLGRRPMQRSDETAPASPSPPQPAPEPAPAPAPDPLHSAPGESDLGDDDAPDGPDLAEAGDDDAFAAGSDTPRAAPGSQATGEGMPAHLLGLDAYAFKDTDVASPGTPLRTEIRGRGLRPGRPSGVE